MNTEFHKNPKACGRLIGILYLALLIVGPFSLLYVPSVLVVAGDPLATASNILSSETLFRFGLLGSTFLCLIEIILTVVLYLLFKPVSYVIALIATFSRLAMTIVQGVTVLLGLVSVIAIVDSNSYTTIEPEELYSLGLLFINAQTYSGYVWGSFFALHCWALAYLIFKSEFLPTFLGILMGIAAFGYSINSLGSLILPQYQLALAAISGLGAFAGELPFLLWLLVKNVNEEKWKQLEKRAG